MKNSDDDDQGGQALPQFDSPEVTIDPDNPPSIQGIQDPHKKGEIPKVSEQHKSLFLKAITQHNNNDNSFSGRDYQDLDNDQLFTQFKYFYDPPKTSVFLHPVHAIAGEPTYVKLESDSLLRLLKVLGISLFALCAGKAPGNYTCMPEGEFKLASALPNSEGPHNLRALLVLREPFNADSFSIYARCIVWDKRSEIQYLDLMMRYSKLTEIVP